MKKFLLSCLSVFFICTLFIYDSYAVSYTFDMPHTKPYAGDNGGYCNILYYNSTQQEYQLRTYAWFWQPADNTNKGLEVHSYVDIEVSSDTVKFEFVKPTTVAAMHLTWSAMGPTWYNVYDTDFTYTNSTSQSYSPDGYIVYVEAFGNVGYIDDSFSSSSIGLIINWADSLTSNQYLEDLVAEMQENNSLTQEIVDILNDLYGTDIDISDSSNANNQLGNSIDEYEGLEQDFNTNFNNSINDLDTTVNLFGVSDFVKTGQFVSTQLTNIFNINDNVENMVIFSLVIGFSLVLIGIGVRR